MSARRIKIRKDKKKPLIVEQWVEVEFKSGVTTTTRYPSDEFMLEFIALRTEQTGRDVDLVYRRFNFVHGVPQEYLWASDDARQIKYGGHAIQRLRLRDWKSLIAQEAGGHMLACEYVMPRPETSGGCDCSTCRGAAKRIAERGR
jgi:hypothetical protein